MKTIMSAGSAVALGVASVVAPLVVAPANAVGTAPVCNPGEPADISGDFDNWYQACVPQFGLGKVEFTISSETDFPADFKDLTDPSVNVTTTTDLDLLNFYLSSDVDSPFLGLSRTDDGSNPKLQRYQAASLMTESLAAFKIAAVSELSPAVAPAACDAFLDVGDSYPRVFSVTFEPLDVTFSQAVNGQEWIYRVVMAPGTQYVAGTLPPGEDDWDSDEPLCISQGNYLAGGSSSGSAGDSHEIADLMSWLVAPYSSNDGFFVADYPRSAPTELPATGLNSLVPLGVGALTLAVGGLAIALRRRRS
jgi:LPXTG-motif cell wall-anchored protein